MAAPAHMSITDITGRWRLNRPLSDTLEPTFSLQGIPWLVRKIINFASLELQYVNCNVPSVQSSLPDTASATVPGPAATRYAFTQTVRPGNFDCQNEYVMDGEKRVSTVPIFGTVTVHTYYVGRENMMKQEHHEHMSIPWARVDSADDDHAAVVEVVSNEGEGWTGQTVWVLQKMGGREHKGGKEDDHDEKGARGAKAEAQAERRLCKYNITTNKEGKTVKAFMVYDYLGGPLV